MGDNSSGLVMIIRVLGIRERDVLKRMGVVGGSFKGESFKGVGWFVWLRVIVDSFREGVGEEGGWDQERDSFFSIVNEYVIYFEKVDT